MKKCNQMETYWNTRSFTMFRLILQTLYWSFVDLCLGKSNVLTGIVLVVHEMAKRSVVKEHEYMLSSRVFQQLYPVC